MRYNKNREKVICAFFNVNWPCKVNWGKRSKPWSLIEVATQHCQKNIG